METAEPPLMANEEEGLVRLQLSGALQGGRVETLRQNAAEAAETIIRAADSRGRARRSISCSISAPLTAPTTPRR